MSGVEAVAVMDKAASDYAEDCSPAHASDMAAASAAVAELIAASDELQFIRNNGCASSTYDAATARHDAALAAVKGEQ